MEKKLILKLKSKDKKTSMILKTENEETIVCYHGMRRILISILDLIEIDYQEVGKLARETDLYSLLVLIQNGFTLRVDETEKGFSLIISKDTCSTSFSSSKEEGISKVLMQAEEWAETFVEDLKTNTSCGI